MAFQSNSAVELAAGKAAARGIRRNAFINKAFLKEVFDKAEFVFAFISLFFFTDAITMVVLTQGVSEGEVLPFSILDNMPTDRPVDWDSSATVISCWRRKARTSRPIATSSAFSRSPSRVRCGS